MRGSRRLKKAISFDTGGAGARLWGMSIEMEIVAARREELRVRAWQEGLEAMDVADLLELLLGRHGQRSELVRQGLSTWARASVACLERELGLSRVEALRLGAAFALGRRVDGARRVGRLSMQTAESVWRYMGSLLRGLERERFYVVLLDGKSRLIRPELVSEGSLTSSIVHPREVFRSAIREGAVSIVLVHNHPSGDPEPSHSDLELTRRLSRIGQVLGIPVLDHVIVGDASYVSLRERNCFDD